jgi:hypothetical protein
MYAVGIHSPARSYNRKARLLALLFFLAFFVGKTTMLLLCYSYINVKMIHAS